MVMVIAEIGSVHDGSLGNALCLIEAAADCGADAVKFQTHIAMAETLPNAPAPSYFRGEPRFEYFTRTAFTPDQWKLLKQRCDECHVTFLSSPFSEEAVDLLETFGMEQYKIPSGEVTNLPLIEKIACLKKPILLSSGMNSLSELDQAVALIRRYHEKLTVLQCTSEYPCPYELVGLNVMLELRTRYDVPTGLSDHTLTPYAAYAAVTLGASVIEKHFTFSRKMYGSDARHSMEPGEFTDMVAGIRAIEIMMSERVDKNDTTRFREMKNIFEKSIVSRVDIPAGTRITKEMLAFKKPGTGIPARELEKVIDKIAQKTIPRDSQLKHEDLA